LKRT